MRNAFYTIGHSTRSIDEFVALLTSVDVGIVADVRTVPRSRTNPQYNRDVLGSSLASFGIKYEHIAALGGLRGKDRSAPPGLNSFWQNESFRNYANYAMSDSFRSGLLRLSELGEEQTCAIMCSESLWWRCHRRIIADYLLAANAQVFHILGPKKIEPARMTPAARPGPSKTLLYPATP
jgi:uncharacterized protein (DUF488 family)